VFPCAAWFKQACGSNASIDGSITRRSCKSLVASQLTTSEVTEYELCDKQNGDETCLFFTLQPTESISFVETPACDCVCVASRILKNFPKI